MGRGVNHVAGDVDVAAAASLIADRTRAALLSAVIDEGPLPAGALAERAGVSASTASEHLARLVDGSFLTREKHGRQRHYRLASPGVAAAFEALASVAPARPANSLRTATQARHLRSGRTCYDHLAGRLGVEVARALERTGALERLNDGFSLGRSLAVLDDLEIDVEELEHRRRPTVRSCLDWSERELHLGGGLGARVTARFFELGWIRRRRGGRAVLVTPSGADGLHATLGVRPDQLPAGPGGRDPR
jgi:DNA-binding transcriptional ArsR family regulator